MGWHAIVNVPGYLPTEPDDTVYDTAEEAWEALAQERRDAEDDVERETDGYSAVVNTLECLARKEWQPEFGVDEVGSGTVVGPTPGYDGDHDQGVAYSVERAEAEENAPTTGDES